MDPTDEIIVLPFNTLDNNFLMLESLSGSFMADPVSRSVTCITAAALVLWVHTSALTTLHLRSVSTALTSDSRPGLSVPVNSIDVYSDAGSTPTDLLRDGMNDESAPKD